jgi:hypothetical protein
VLLFNCIPKRYESSRQCCPIARFGNCLIHSESIGNRIPKRTSRKARRSPEDGSLKVLIPGRLRVVRRITIMLCMKEEKFTILDPSARVWQSPRQSLGLGSFPSWARDSSHHAAAYSRLRLGASNNNSVSTAPPVSPSIHEDYPAQFGSLNCSVTRTLFDARAFC